MGLLHKTHGFHIRHGRLGKQTFRTHDDEQIVQTTLGNVKTLKEISAHIYTQDEIDAYNIVEAINDHPLAHRPTNIRSKLAYKEILKNLKPTKKYLLPGQIVCFEYLDPKYKEQLDYYDKTPLVLFCGITRTDDGNIREIGFNLHYYPPYARMQILRTAYAVFKQYFDKYFNDPASKPNMFISYKALKGLLERRNAISFGIKMYIPTLRARSYVIPTRMLPTAYYTEGHFNKATLAQIQHFWRTYRR